MAQGTRPTEPRDPARRRAPACPADALSILKTPYLWRSVTSYFEDTIPTREVVSNVHVVPFVGSRVVLLHARESGWGPSGGTVQDGEPIDSCVRRELAEEIGAEVRRYELFGQWNSFTTAATAYRPWLPHPRFSIALGWADVLITSSSQDDGGVEMESITEVVIMPVQGAVRRLADHGEHHLAALYQLAYEVRRTANR
ncbi:NUDIX hydrolase [Actinomadura harenae]|uniref:NUDIX domain-containing protein n=1 Tax=Actinomadura harenae TaxID=2483351 RepID=A0A3M2LY82_9ACTN|nr:NUDIX domain-containing protein [Actinomadura harenae]RMI42474.1 NUDIX domain-containing protein [Actinomadura harenae]